MIPPGPWDRFGTQIHLRYGVRAAPVSLAVDGEMPPSSAGESPDRPARLFVAPRIIRKLHIRTEPIYRLRPFEDGLEIGPVLGLLLGSRNHWYDDVYLGREPERVTDVYARTGGLFCAFSPRNLSLLDGCAYGHFYDPGQKRWRTGVLPVPGVIHRRSFLSTSETEGRLRSLSVHIFNSRRYTKWEVFKILSQDEILRGYLPETAQIAAGAEVFDLLQRHSSVLLKPSELSRGRGILFVEREGTGCRVLDCRQGGPPGQTLMDRQAMEFFLSKLLRGRPYLCQEKIDLATAAGSPFDIRAVMQRDPAGRWECPGIECRVAGRGSLITNIAYGGRALGLGEAVEAAFGGGIDPAEAEAAIRELAHRVCLMLDRTGESFGEFGIDLAFDRAGKLWFIEANVVPTFHGFEKLDPVLYRRLLAAPLLYASHLAGFDAAAPAGVGGEQNGAPLPDRGVAETLGHRNPA